MIEAGGLTPRGEGQPKLAGSSGLRPVTQRAWMSTAEACMAAHLSSTKPSTPGRKNTLVRPICTHAPRRQTPTHACLCAARHLIRPVVGLRPRRGVQTDAKCDTHTHTRAAAKWGPQPPSRRQHGPADAKGPPAARLGEETCSPDRGSGAWSSNCRRARGRPARVHSEGEHALREEAGAEEGAEALGRDERQHLQPSPSPSEPAAA